jgi:predicted transcriptional regulator
MQILWEKKQATAREITDALNDYEPIVHKNVQTLIRTLEAKGAVAHKAIKNTHIYYPVLSDKKVLHSLVHDFLDRFFTGSAGSLVSAILKNKLVSRDELRSIYQKIGEYTDEE